MEGKTKIILTRKTEWMNRFRGYRVLIDGIDRGQIINEGTGEFDVAPGTHLVQCKLSWYSSPMLTVNLQNGDIQYLRVKSGMTYYWPLFFVLFAGILVNVFSKTYPQKPAWLFYLQMILILPALCYMLYYLTLGRHQYLKLEEDIDNVFM